MDPFDNDTRKAFAKECKAPKGKFRILCIDMFDYQYYIYDDYETKHEAMLIAEEMNRQETQKEADNKIPSVYSVYDDKGDKISE